MGARIVDGVVAGLAQNENGLPAAGGFHANLRPDGRTVRRGAGEAGVEPVVGRGVGVLKQRRGLVHVHDEEIDAAVVIEVAGGSRTARMTGLHTGAGAGGNVFKLAVSQVPVKQARIAEFLRSGQAIDFVEDVAGR